LTARELMDARPFVQVQAADEDRQPEERLVPSGTARRVWAGGGSALAMSMAAPLLTRSLESALTVAALARSAAAAFAARAAACALLALPLSTSSAAAQAARSTTAVGVPGTNSEAAGLKPGRNWVVLCSAGAAAWPLSSSMRSIPSAGGTAASAVAERAVAHVGYHALCTDHRRSYRYLDTNSCSRRRMRSRTRSRRWNSADRAAERCFRLLATTRTGSGSAASVPDALGESVGGRAVDDAGELGFRACPSPRRCCPPGRATLRAC
jgi:hypothetical protein